MNIPPPECTIAHQRSSNNELLRIVCMFFIVLHHFLVHAVFIDTLDTSAHLCPNTTLSILTNGFLYIGVNCFILISGFYRVRLRWKNLLNLFCICAFYGLVGYLFHLWYDCASIGKSLLYNSIFIFSHSTWWYINCYLILLLLSPLINTGIDHLSKKAHIIVIIGLTICQLYFGYYWQEDMYDTSGYSFLQFLYMYLIGAYLSKYNYAQSYKRYTYLFIYIAAALIWGFITCLNHIYNINSFWHPFTYNNPLVILASISFFLFFQTIHFQNNRINVLAKGTLAAYLVQDQAYFGSALYSTLRNSINQISPSWHFIVAVGMSILFLFLITSFDLLRARIMRPIVKLSSFMDKKFPLAIC